MEQDRSDFPKRFFEATGRRLRLAVPLKEHSSFRIGGKADFFIEAATAAELAAGVSLARTCGIRSFVIGGGYNILFDDKGFRGLIVKNRASGIERLDDVTFSVSSGTGLKEMLAFCAEAGLQGFEFLAGIPGTVGGAVYGNAGAFGECIGTRLVEAVLLTKDGEKKNTGGEDLGFGYRDSRLKKTGEILLEAVFRLEPGDAETVRRRMEANIAGREKKHPPSTTACAGSYFKNPYPPGAERAAAAVLLDKVGAKSLRCGGAAVSPRHANFIVNEGNARAEDVLTLADKLKKRVLDAFGVELEEEVIFLPESSPEP